MNRFFVASLALLFSALPMVQAIPGRLPYDIAKQKTPDPSNLVGSSWFGSDIESGDWEITFQKDGTITYTYNGRTFRNGTWLRQGNVLYFETNKKFYEFRGTLQGDVIDGESWNVKGSRWHTSMYRVAGAK